MDECITLSQPQEHAAKICIWSDLTVSDMDMINEAGTPDKIKYELARIFNMGNFEEDPQSDVLMELYFNVIQFAKSKGLSKEQTSCLFSIVKKTHEVAIETPFGNLMETFRYFEGLILCHSVKRPPYSIDIFKPEEVRLVVQFVLDTYFRQFKMYKYVFTPMVRLDMTLTYVDEKGEPLDEEPEEEEAVDETAGEEKEENVDESQAEETNGVNEKAAVDKPVPGEDSDMPPSGEDESPAMKELKALIRAYLSDQMKLLQTEVEQHMKVTDEVITAKIKNFEKDTTTPKSANKSKQGKK